jgi:hypothetical protein
MAPAFVADFPANYKPPLSETPSTKQSMRGHRGKRQCVLQSECHVSPHPGPFPWGEGDVPLPFSKTKRGVCWANLPSNRTYGGLFPLPLGEGQGEDSPLKYRETTNLWWGLSGFCLIVSVAGFWFYRKIDEDLDDYF